MKSDPGNTNLLDTCIKCFSSKAQKSTLICRYRKSIKKRLNIRHVERLSSDFYFALNPLFLNVYI